MHEIIRSDVLPGVTSAPQQQKFYTAMTWNLSGIWSGTLIGWIGAVDIVDIVYEWQTKGHVRSNVNEMNVQQAVNIPGLYFSLEKAFEFHWSLFTKEHTFCFPTPPSCFSVGIWNQ